MFQTLINAWKIVDLRKKLLYTLFIILIFRIGSAISVPFVDVEILRNAVNGNEGFMAYLTLLSGGGFSNASIFALSITPYINASIIIQLLTVALPPLERLSKEGEAGRKNSAPSPVTPPWVWACCWVLRTTSWCAINTARWCPKPRAVLRSSSPRP